MFASDEKIKSGIVALVGPPNVGKSTLLNNLLGQKISIVSHKPQTTRNRILGIVNGDDYQIVMLDTPGIHQARGPLNKEMVRIAMESLAEVDVIVFMVDVTLKPPAADSAPAQVLKQEKKPIVLLLNKVDLIEKDRLLPLIAAYRELYNFAVILPISALTGDGTELVVEELCKLLPDGPRLYPDDIPTDATERFIVAEIIREKVFLLTGQEIPYSTAVTIESFKENSRKAITTIHATIHVEKKSQKGIIIGKGGKKLQKIGQDARADIEALLDQKVLLKLWVKVQKDWTKNSSFLKELGF